MSSASRKPKKPQRPKEELLRPLVKKEGVPDVSLEELASCLEDDAKNDAKEDGAEQKQQQRRLWIGCKGRIFDVGATEDGREFYGSGGSYSSFVGRDASVALGKMKFDAEFFDPSKMHWTRDLDEKELNILQDWTDKFEGKYPVVGYIKDDGAQ